MDIGKYSVLLMRVESKPWQIEGNSGVATTVHFMEGGKVYKAKTSEAIFEQFKEVVQKEAVISLSLDSYNGVPRLICTGIKM